MTTPTEQLPATFGVDPALLQSIVDGVDSCLAMCGRQAKCVGVSTVPIDDSGSVTGLIGLHGEVSGFITVNMAEHAAMSAVGGLLQDEFEKLTPQVVDGVGEITNIIAGGIKRGLAGTQWGFRYVTVPSVIVGQNYHIAFAAGLQYLSVTFEQPDDDEALVLNDRLVKVALSLIRP